MWPVWLTLALCVAPLGVMAKFKNETRYDALIRSAGASYGVPVPIIKGVIGVESSFNPTAYNPEPQVGNDASRGLMQLLERTARGLGFTRPVDDLYDPSVSIGLGTKLLSRNYSHAAEGLPGEAPGAAWEIAISAYNAGWSPTRPYDAKRTATQEFVNQRYVDDVLRLADYFGGVPGLRVPAPKVGPKLASAAVIALLGGGLYWLLFH